MSTNSLVNKCFHAISENNDNFRQGLIIGNPEPGCSEVGTGISGLFGGATREQQPRQESCG